MHSRRFRPSAPSVNSGTNTDMVIEEERGLSLPWRVRKVLLRRAPRPSKVSGILMSREHGRGRPGMGTV